MGEATVFHFVLTAGPGAPGTSVRVTIANDSGVVVYAVRATAGTSASASSVLLVPGQYTVTVEVENPSGAPVSYTITGGVTTNPAGPATIDPTLKPQYVAPPPPGSTTAFAYPPAPISYDPATLSGYVSPADPSTYPLGWAPPRELLAQPWFLLTSDPYLWLTLGN